MRTKLAIRLGLIVAIAVGIAWVATHRELLSPEAVQAQVGQWGGWAPAAFVVLWLIAPVLFVPGGPLTLAAGALFGPVWGAAYSLIGATVGASLAFLLARHVSGDWAQRHARGRLAPIKAGVEVEGWRFVAFARLVPVIPFNLLNYALGLTRIRLREYVWATLFGMIPGAVGYAYLGHAGREALLGTAGWMRTAMIAIAVLSSLILLPLMIRHWRRARPVAPVTLAAWLRQGQPISVLDVRSAQEYAGSDGRIESSFNIPVDNLPERLPELEPLRGRPLIVV
jgi:uncharacterized membrane protein YdjX (TVP38/TMEM64 family)